MIENLRSFVVDTITIREKDILVTLLTQKTGLVRAVAKHGRISKRRFPGALEVGVELFASLRRGRHYTLLEAVDVISYNQDVRENLEGAVLLLSACDMVSSIVPEGKEEPGIFRGFLELIEGLRGRNKMESFLFFSVDTLKNLGYLAVGDRCPLCGKGLNSGCFFRPQDMHFICKNHRGEGILLSPGSFSFIKGRKKPLASREKAEILSFVRLFFRRYFHFVPNSLQALDDLL